ncbi:WD repeat-containing protein 76-like [Oratosquilla oratoria]|uniref:WD repeat-containing protein 76-like n=1 Tax=Oratosquilla oratoria TaxID=337810 RepID=UPI003F76EB6F
MDIRKYLGSKKKVSGVSKEVDTVKQEELSPVKCSEVCKAPAAKKLKISKDETDYSKNDDDDWTPDEVDNKNILTKVKEKYEAEPIVNGVLSDYELMVQKNIEDRMKFLESLDIFTAKEAINELAPKPKPKPVKPAKKFLSPKKPKETAPRRQSLRLQGKALEPDVKPVLQEEEEEDKYTRPPPGPADLITYYNLKDKENCEKFVEGLHTKTSSAVWGHSLWNDSKEKIKKILCGMSINENQVAKVVPQRTFSVEVHPTTDTTLVLTGGKWGELGIWDIEAQDEDNGIFYFNVHSRPINCLTIDKQNVQQVYTTSYDGSCRRTDLEKGIVQEVWSLEDTGYNDYISWHSHRDNNSILIASSSGTVYHVDLREDGSSAQKLKAHKQSVKVVTSHPRQPEYYATSSRNGEVCLWDIRKKGTSVDSVIHKKNVSGLHFSQDTGKYLVSTCSDDRLRVLEWNQTSLQVKRSIHHNNCTGRWLTTFKARWLPGSDDLFVVGSMLHPRRIEIWTSEGTLLHSFLGEWLGSVCSVNAMHPTRPILAGANSSGRLHVFR